jgi:general secretion pathway protein C
MEVLLRKYFWVFNLVVIALAAGFLARATEHLLEGAFLPPAERPVGPRSSFAASPRPSHSKDETEILKRNIFCSTCPPIIAKPEETAQGGAGGTQKTSLPLKLILTMVAEDPAWSSAVLCDTQSKECGAFGLSSPIKDGTIISIDQKRVEFELHGHVEYVEFETASPAVASNTPTPPFGDDDPLGKEMDHGVKKLSETEYQVNRDLLDKVLGNTNLLASSARIVPNVIDGKASGFKLYAIRPGSVYSRIGLQNGDSISAINGYDMSSPDKALEVYTKLRRANHLSVSISRRGQPMTMDYTIR